MTIEERVKNTCEAFFHAGYIKTLTEEFSALIEDAAKICDEHEREETERANESNRNGKGLSQLGHVFEASAAKTIGEKIRALAEPKKEEAEHVN